MEFTAGNVRITTRSIPCFLMLLAIILLCAITLIPSIINGIGGLFESFRPFEDTEAYTATVNILVDRHRVASYGLLLAEQASSVEGLAEIGLPYRNNTATWCVTMSGRLGRTETQNFYFITINANNRWDVWDVTSEARHHFQLAGCTYLQ